MLMKNAKSKNKRIEMGHVNCILYSKEQKFQNRLYSVLLTQQKE